MPTKQGKAPYQYFKNDLTINQDGNTGVDTYTRLIHDGAGQSTSMSVSTKVFQVQPTKTDTTGAMLVRNQGGSNVLAVDTTNSRVLCGSSQTNALTQYTHFSATQMDFAGAGTHYAIPFQSSSSFNDSDVLIEPGLGSGTNPATSFDVSTNTSDSNINLPCYWYIVDPITITGVHVIVGGSAASATDNINFHMMKYDFDTSGGTGDLSSGVVVADQGASGTISDVHEDAIQYASLTVDTSNNTIAPRQVVLCTVESTGTTEISCTVTVKYHIN